MPTPKSLAEHLEPGGPKRILALDGGGIRGILTLGYLEKVEKKLQERHNSPNLRLCDYFDLIGGTSTGAIIAAGLATGMYAAEIKELYRELGNIIFGKKYWSIWYYLSGRQFNSKPLKKALKEKFRDIRLGSEEIQTGLCIVTKRADTFSTWPLLNNSNGKYYDSNKEILLREAIRASTAAPTYFEPQTINVGTLARPEYGSFVDGGVSMANNPALQLFMVATLDGFRFNWPTGDNKLFILSLGTGYGINKFNFSTINRFRLLKWAKKLPDYFMVDAFDHNELLLQYLSSSPTARVIDTEVSNLENDLLHAQNALHYIRYNAILDEKALKELGLSFHSKINTKFIKQIREMSDPRNISFLAEIGEKSAEEMVKEEHFPEVFDLP